MFDKFRHSFVIFGINHPDCYVEMTPYRMSSKMLFTDKDGHLTKLFKRKNMTLQVNCQKDTRTETGVIVD